MTKKDKGKILGKAKRGNYTGTGKTTGQGDPFGGLDITIVKKPAGTITGTATTDTSGQFTFDSIPDGDYTMYVDVAGVPMDTFFNVTIASGSTTQNLVIQLDSSYIDVWDETGIHTAALNGLWGAHLFPNPASRQITLQYSLAEQANVSVQVVNLTGEQVALLQPGTTLPSGQYQLEYSMNLPAGLYFVKWQVNNKIFTQKLTIQ